MCKWNLMNKSPPIRVALVSSPGHICDATCITLTATEGLHLVAIASGALTATKLIQTVQPDLVLVDTSLPDNEAIALIRWMTDQRLGIPCLAAVRSSAHCEQALDSGASVAVRRDELVTALNTFVKNHFQHAAGADVTGQS